MAFPIEDKLVVAVSSSALFDLTKEDEIFRNSGVEAFKTYQREHRNEPPETGTAFPFIRRLLHLNKVFPDQKPVEVVLLSRNDPEAGLRIMDAMPVHGLEITRANFLSGVAPYPYLKAFNAVLYLSANAGEVKEAIDKGYPAGYVLPCRTKDDLGDTQLRICFDFDGVIVDDEAEKVYKYEGLPLFHHHELENKDRPLRSGPLMPLLKRVSNLQRLERELPQRSNQEGGAIRVSILTARNAPAHERLITTLKEQDIEVDELFLTGGVEKKNYLDIMKPNIFFDDQLGHLTPAAPNTPSVHIPFGIRNADQS